MFQFFPKQVFYEEELDVPLVLFNEVLDHVLRIDRIFRQPQVNTQLCLFFPPHFIVERVWRKATIQMKQIDFLFLTHLELHNTG